MVQALYERGIAPDLLVGTSAGALNAAYLATRPPTVQTAIALGDVWRGVRTFEVFPPSPVSATLALLGRSDHLFSNWGLRRLLGEHLHLKRMEDAAIPVHLVATEVVSGAERLLSTGDAQSAVLASAAIPGVFPAIHRDGRVLVDGGVADNTAISQAVTLGADPVYVLPTGFGCRLAQPPQSAVAMITHAITLLINQRLAADVQRLRGQTRLIVLPPPCPVTVSPADFGDADQLIRLGLAEARRALDDPDPEGAPTRTAVSRMLPHEG
jgi:NTE family protein